ncbi:WXG100-like domain-containing protein [Streptomyces sp. NPDC001770]
MDAHHVPPELQNLLLVVVGNKWPTGDETALRAEAAVWRACAETMRSCAQDVAEVRARVDAGLQGQTREAVDGFLDRLAGPGEDAVLPLTITCCEEAAEALDTLANEIETLRIEIIGALVVLAVQLMIDMTVLLLCGGPAAAAGEIAATRVLCMAFLRRAVTHALVRVAESVVAQVGFALLAQVIELGQHHRTSLDGDELAVAAVNGAVGGAVGFGAGLLAGGATHGVTRGAGLAALGAAGSRAAGVVSGIGFSALAGSAEGAAQDAVFGLSGDWIAGAANGAFNGAWGARHTGMNPKNIGSISPADHLENLLDGLPKNPAGAPGTAESEGPPSPGTPSEESSTESSGETVSQFSVGSVGSRPATVAVEPSAAGPYAGEPTGEEGHEVWQDVPWVLRGEDPPGGSPTTEPFDPGPNPWADVETDSETVH